jgi:UDP-N-acetylglucosamine 1-carboxyvinyltransferase
MAQQSLKEHLMLKTKEFALRVNPTKMHGGSISINGYKHAMVQVVCAAIATGRRVQIENTPNVDDTSVFSKIIIKGGGSVIQNGNTWEFDTTDYFSSRVPPQLSRLIHGSLYLMPALAARFGKFEFAEAGGCQIGDGKKKGARPIEHMLSVMNSFGIECHQDNGSISGKRISTPSKVEVDISSFSTEADKLAGSHMSGATKTALLCALNCDSVIIHNPYHKADVSDLILFIRKLGTHDLRFVGTSIVLNRVRQIKSSATVSFTLTDCVSEVMTYITAAVHMDLQLSLAVSDGERVASALRMELQLLREAGVPVLIGRKCIKVNRCKLISPLNIEVTNDSIQSDHHPFFALILMRARSKSTITEHVWRERFGYVSELVRLGACMVRNKNSVHIEPSEIKIGRQVLMATDTRAAAICLLGSLRASGPTLIEFANHLDRGYADLVPSLRKLGADIEKIYYSEIKTRVAHREMQTQTVLVV